MELQEILVIMEKAKEVGLTSLDLTLAGERIQLAFSESKAISQPYFISGVTNSSPFTNSSPSQQPIGDVKIEDIFKAPPHLSDDILNNPEKIKYYHSPYFDELEAKEKAHQEQLNNNVKE